MKIKTFSYVLYHIFMLFSKINIEILRNNTRLEFNGILIFFFMRELKLLELLIIIDNTNL